MSSGNTTPRGEHATLALSKCGNGMATIVRGLPYVEITRDPGQGFDVVRLLTIHEEKRHRRSDKSAPTVLTINDIIACEYD